MKDIDFDELDRAVSSVLETPADETPTTGPAPVKTETEDQPSDTSTASVADEVPAEPETVPVVVDRPKPALAVKRRGQFMDVVHPSSDMTGKPTDVQTSSPKKVSLQPISTVTEPDTTSDAEVEPLETTETVETPSSEAAPVVAEAPAAAEGQSWPDPLDVMEAKEEETATAESTPADAPVEAVDEAAGATTPFLTDTKVDKRPLDAFSGEETSDGEDVAPEVNAEPELTSPELQPDIIAVEASATDQSSTEESTEEPADPTTSSQFNESIPQQYAATETQADDEHSIFDTKEYHQPLSPTEKKKGGVPGWVKALLIVFLLAGLGAAGGYFWFYYGI